MIIPEDCKTSKQCVAAANKAMSKLRVIKRTSKYFNTDCFAVVYKTNIPPHLEYCIQAWSPSLKKGITIHVLEKVQRRATKLISTLRSMSYPERLAELNLYSLERRSLSGHDPTEVFKILNGFEGNYEAKLFTRRQNKNRGQSYKLCNPALKSVLTAGENFSPSELINEWNILPAQAVEAESTNMIKNKLDSYLSIKGYGVVKD